MSWIEEIYRLKAKLEQYKRDAERMRERARALELVAIEMRGWISCDDVNHKNGEFHDFGECPVLARIDAALNKQQAQGCGACGDGCEGKQCRVKEESPPADNWLDLAHELESVGLRYWKAADRERNKGAVKWIKNEETGFMAVVTRGEYSCELKAFCESLPFYSKQQAEVRP